MRAGVLDESLCIGALLIKHNNIIKTYPYRFSFTPTNTHTITAHTYILTHSFTICIPIILCLRRRVRYITYRAWDRTNQVLRTRWNKIKHEDKGITRVSRTYILY
jgi:hypothetical protein